MSMMAFLLLLQEENAVDSDSFFFLILGIILLSFIYFKISKIFLYFRYLGFLFGWLGFLRLGIVNLASKSTLL